MMKSHVNIANFVLLVFAIVYFGDDDDDDDDKLFLAWLTNERRLALFLAGNIVRDPHHRQSPRRRNQDLNLRRI